MVLFLAATAVSASAVASSSKTASTAQMFLPYGNVYTNPDTGNYPDPDYPDTVWVRAFFLGPIGKPIKYDENGQPFYHLKGKFEFKVYDGKKGISIKDSSSYYPNGINIYVRNFQSNGEARTYINLKPGVFAKLSKAKQANLDIVVLKDGKKVGTRKLNYHEPSEAKIDSIKVSGKKISVILKGKKNYLFKDAVILDLRNNKGETVKESYYIQPKFDKNGKFVCPTIKLDKNTEGKYTLYLFDYYMGWQNWDVIPDIRIDKRPISVK